MTWNPISEHKFPWDPHRLVVAAYSKGAPEDIEVFLCTCADGGYYDPDGEILALDELGWVPFAWTEGPPPSRGVTEGKGTE